MANTSDYAKKKKEQDDAIQAALQARSARMSASASGASSNSQNTYYANKKAEHDSKIQTALEERRTRLQKSMPDTLSRLQNRINAEINAYNRASPVYGSHDETVRSQTTRRANLSKLRSEVEAYRSYMGDEAADSLISALDQMKGGYNAHLEMSRFDSEEAYQQAYEAAVRDYTYRQKYQGKDYDDIQEILGRPGLNHDSEEYKWLEEYGKSDEIMTSAVRGRLIEETRSKLNWYRNNNSTVLLNSEAVLSGADPFEVYGGRYDDVIKALGQELEALQAGKWRLDNEAKYGALSENADFEELSMPASEKPTAVLGVQFGEKWLGIGDPTYDYINDLGGARAKEQAYAAERADNPHLYKYSFMTQEEIASYNYLYQAEGKEAANEYLEYLSYELDARRTQKLAGDSAEFASEHPVLSSVYSVPANLVSGAGMLDIAGQNAVKRVREAITGEYAGPINYNSMAMGASVQTTAIRGTVAQSIADRTGVINLDTEEHPILSKILNGKSLGDVYQLGMSMADSATVAALSPVIGSAGVALLGGSAGTQGVLAAVEAGASDEQALAMGVLNAAFEMLFEKVSLDNLLKGDTRSLVKAVFQQGFIEGTEELNTTLFNNIADILVMAEKSDYRKNIAAYMEQGFSEEDATKQALLDMAVQMGWDFVGGMLSGGVMGGGGAAVNTVQQNREMQRIYGTEVSALIDEALDIDPQNPLAIKLKERLDAGKNISGGQIYNLVQQNEAGMVRQDMADIQGAATARLAELGETGDVHAVGAALAKQAAGERLTRAERRLIENSKYGQRVANELDAENIRSGEYTSEWAGRIGTSRINADEYNTFVEAAQNAQEPAGDGEGTVVVSAPKMAQEGVQVPTVAKNATVQKERAAAPVESAEDSTATQETAAEEKPMTIEDASKKYGAQAGAMIHTYQKGQDVEKYNAAYGQAYNMGKSGVSLSYAMDSEGTAYLTEKQRELAYEAGKAASDAAASTKDAKNKAAANGKTGRVKGTVKGEGVTIADLKKTFNDTQGKAYKYLSTVAEVTGINIVLYKSEANAEGKYTEAQGKYRQSEPGTLYIDINAGLSDVKGVDDLAKYAMLRTFAHEFTHFIENWNPIQYNEFRKVVFDTLSERGENAHDLIEEKMARTGLGYDAASREVVAEAMTDILPDANFVQNLAEKHKSIFAKLLEKLQEFAENLREYFTSIGHNPSREANALKKQVGDAVKYVESIVKLFDNVAVQAVENYQATVAVDEVADDGKSAEEPVVDLSGKDISRAGDTITIGDPAKATHQIDVTITDEEWETVKQIIPQKKAEAPVPGASVPLDAYSDLQERLKQYDRVDIGGIRFSAKAKKGGGYYGNIKYLPVKAGGVPVENARGTIYSSYTPGFATMGEAIEDLVAVARNNKLLDEKPAETTETTEEVTSNAENADIPGAVQQPVLDREGDARLLDEPEAGNVPGDGRRGNPVGSAGEGGRQTVQSGRGSGGRTGDGSGHGKGSRQSGDLRRSDGVSEEETAAREYAAEKGYEIKLNPLAAKKGSTQADIYDKDGLPTFNPVVIHEESDWNTVRKSIARREEAEAIKADDLHEDVVEQIAQCSTELPKGRNFVIGDSLELPNGEKARYKANIAAIQLVKKLEAEGRYATEEEQAILSRYVGWGGLANAFDERKADWAKEYKELKELLTDEEYNLARGSTLNAHYTEISVIKAMYDGLARLGFNGGRMLEPSSGVGNFVGAMPVEMSSKVQSWTMVELDGITGLIAKYLYPNADVRIQGFETANIPNNYMDVAISNVPFGNYPVTDKKYPKKVTGAIHNYFFAKSLDKVRPGGIVMFITSSYTMNSKDSTVRRYIMQQADLLGAIRLPDTAFKGNAGTEVVTDILVLKKRAPNTDYAGVDFLEAPYQSISGWRGANVNTYFQEHPEMVLGTPSMDGSMYRGDSLTYKAFTDRGSLADQIREAFSHIEGKMDYPAKITPERANFAVERADKKTKNNGLVSKGGKIYKNENGELVEQTVAKGVAERITGLLEIRDAARALHTYLQQGVKESEIKKARKRLNTLYDAYVKKYGFLNAPANRSAIKDDPDSYSILALENWNPETKTAAKADIFSKNTIAPNRTVTSAKDVAEGLIVSRNETGGVDVALIARLTGKTEDAVTRELVDGRLAFKTRDGDLEAAEVYLSGNVRAKLRDAEALVPLDADYANNVDALRAIVPEDIPYQDIFVNPGTPWIPDSVYSDFAAYMLGSYNSEWRPAVIVTRSNDTGNFTVELKEARLKHNAYNTQKWGTPRRSFLVLFDAMLNSRSVVVKYKTDDGQTIVDKDATAAANEKIENITREFQEWLWKDEGRRAELVTLYNETFNAIVTPKYNGDNLTVNGANAMKPLRPHQRDAVQRVISSGGNTLLAHKVGAGKTYEMAAAAMKLKQLGLVKKPMFAVPKSLVAQWGQEFMDFFPTARLLVAEASDFTAANRKIFANRIANGNYDAVIVSYEQFEKLPMSDEFTRELYQEQIDSIIRAIEEAKAESGGKSLSVKDLEKKRKALQAKIDKLTDKAKDEDNIEFEQLGVDSLFIDEAHNFKNLFYTTSMTNVSGLGNKDGSKRAFDLYTKVRYLQRLNGGRGIVFATATPVMNSMSEMYIMQKYLQPDLLDQLGLSTFDAWAKQFGEVVNGVEIKPSGQGYRVKQSFSRFKNMGELQLLFRNFADVLTEIPGLKIPKMKGGKVTVVVCEPGQFQQDYMQELEKRADNIKNVDPSVDNMLKITSDGRKISYTQRMIEPTLPYEEGCKIFRCADNVARVYKESKAVKGTQLIFCDMATPKGKSKTSATETEEAETDMESAKLYDDIKARLVKSGIPAKEIAFIHEADTDAKKKKLFADVNDGTVRVLIGSTGKMGVGMNAQKRVVAIHHLDAPWRPGDVEQRNGRAFRQGNINDEVECFTYVTEGSFDARLWDILERKQNFINQVMNGENVGREAEDTGEVTLSAAEVKALASGSPLIMEQVQLETDIKKLESLRRAHMASLSAARTKMEKDKASIASYETRIAAGKADMASRVDAYSEGRFSITVGKKTYTDKKDAGVALMAEATARATEGGYTAIGRYAGFELRVVKTHEGIKGLIVGRQGYNFNTYPNNTTYMINHLVAIVEGISTSVEVWEQNLSETRKDLAEQEKLAAASFAKQEELDRKRARYNEVMSILNPKEEQSLDSIDEGAEQNQSRAYLGEDKYSYEWLVSKPDMPVTMVGGDVPGNRADVVAQAKKNAAKVGKFDPKTGSVSVHVDDIGADVVLGTKGLQHGLRRINKSGPEPNWFVTLKAGEVIKNAIRINELTPSKEEATGAYVLIGAAQNPTGDLYVVRFVVNQFSNELASMDVLYAINAKKENRLRSMRPGFQGPVTDSIISIAELLDHVNRYFPDILPESVLKHYGHEYRPDGDLGEDALYQQRTDTLTDREVLDMAADELAGAVDLTDGERDALRIFRERLEKLRQLQEKRQELGTQYKEQQFGPAVDRKAAAETLNRMHVLDEQIKKASAAVLSVEDKAVLKRVLQKARKVVEQQERERGREVLNRWRERRNNAAAIKKYRERIRADVDELTGWVLHPNNKDVVKHIPDALKNTVIPFLSSIDFTSKQQLRGGAATRADKEFMKRLTALRNALKQNMDLNGMYSGYNDLPPDFMENLQSFIDSAQAIVDSNGGEFVINQMTGEELRELSKVVRTLKKYITQLNRFHANAMYQHVYEAGDDSIRFLDGMKNASEKTGTVSNFILWQQIRPAYAFERFGDGGMAIYDGLRRGQATLAFNTQKIKDFAEKTYTAAEVKAWEKQIKTINLGGDLVKMPVSTIMSFYELSKRPQALGHILGNGVRVATYKNGREKISDVGHMLTPGDISTIVQALTPRQREVADALQKFMAEQGGEWGNYVSVRRFGEELFGEEHYFPIHSDGRHLQANADEHPSAASLYALLNMSFTKELKEEANNRIILYSIFDVFANHMASMAQYNALALPVLDALKWFNYQQKDADTGEVLGSVREQMSRVYGVPEETRPGSGRQGYAETFVMNILKAFNGTEAQGVPTDTTGITTLRRYNMAQVAYNFRVVVQQPLSITRAALLVDYSSIIKGMRLAPRAIRKNIEEMRKYSGIAAWKGLGFYDINISRGLTSLIKHDTTPMDKIGDWGMWGAEKADTLTWAGIWSACKEEVIRKQKLKPGNEGFHEAVTKLFEDVIYKTQVVDSVLTKNEYMRSKGFFARAIGSFMSEPTTTASMLIDAYDKYSADMQRGMTRQQAWKKNRDKIVRTVYVYGISAALLAAVQAAADALRDDDDYQTFLEKWLEAFKGNIVDELMPLNKLPIVSDFYEVAKGLASQFGVDTYGNAPTSVFMQWYDSLIKGVEILHDKIAGEDTNYTWYGGAYKLLQAVSGMTGLPMASATREIITAWNNIVGAMAPSLKVKTYEPSEKSQIKYAYQDGYLTAEEAMDELLAQGLVEDEDEAYWTMQGWEAGEGYSRYDALHDAVRNGGDVDAAMEELTAHGYTEKDVISHIKSKVGEWYRGGEITDTQAKSMLTKYTDLSSEDVDATVNEWSCEVVTGISIGDIREEYIAGNITAAQAKSMRVRYSGDTEEEAAEKIAKWSVEQEYGFAYEDRATAYKNGDISADELRTVLMEVGGKTYEDADLQVQVYDWQMEVPECDDITASAIEDYNNYCAPVGISKADYYDAWRAYNDTPADYDDAGDSIPYSKTIKVMPYIDGLPLTAEQKTALALCWWSQSTVSKYRLW